MVEFEAGTRPRISNPLVLISSLAEGGAERVTVSFLRRLVAQGKRVTLCTITNRFDSFLAEDIRSAGIERIDLGAHRLASARLLIRYVRLLRRKRFDIVHAHGQDASILAAFGRCITGVPLVMTRHVQEEPSANWRENLRARAALAAFRRADRVVAVSDSTARRLHDLTRLDPLSVRIIHNGIELERFQNPETKAQRKEIRASLGAADDDFLILVLSVLRPGKGHDVLLRAWPSIQKRRPHAKLVIAGGGEMQSELVAQAELLGNSVRLLGARNDVPGLLAACDLLVLPSVSEALPTVIMEAAAARKAVIATNVGGVPELVEDGKTGVLVPPGDGDSLADAILQLIFDPNRLRNFGEEAERKAIRQFSMDRQITETLKLWNEVIVEKNE